MIELKKCPICDIENQWELLDYLRDHNYWYQQDFRTIQEDVGFKICKNCGFITYDYKDQSELEILYDNQRKVMQANNIITCNRKNEYHYNFLKAYLRMSVRDVSVLDVGCAQGSFLDFFRKKYHGHVVDLDGIEWSQGYAAFAEHEYGVNILKDIAPDKKYDFICNYKVLEHMQYPDKELKKEVDALKDKGFIYISIPLMLPVLEESSGIFTIDFENLYHLNHVNCFTKTSFQNLLKKVGLKIIKEDNYMYGYTVLCQKCDFTFELAKEDYIEIKTNIERQKQAIELARQKKYSEAIAVYPQYPDAYILLSIDRENQKSFDAGKDILFSGLSACPDNPKLISQLARLYYQWNQNTPEKVGYYSNNIQEAEKIFLQIIEKKPGYEDAYWFMGMIEGDYKKNYSKAVEYFKKVIEINPAKFVECWNFISYFWKEANK